MLGERRRKVLEIRRKVEKERKKREKERKKRGLALLPSPPHSTSSSFERKGGQVGNL